MLRLIEKSHISQIDAEAADIIRHFRNKCWSYFADDINGHLNKRAFVSKRPQFKLVKLSENGQGKNLWEVWDGIMAKRKTKECQKSDVNKCSRNRTHC